MRQTSSQASGFLLRDLNPAPSSVTPHNGNSMA
jgi:hypothetical protein